MLLEMPLVAATSSDVLSHAVMTVQCCRQPFNRRDVSCNKRDWFHRACPVFLYGVLWVGWVGGSPCGVKIANLLVAIRVVSWIA